ncbi:MAG: hypothetical protein LBT46_09995 [Planctomycetaceae bacterium]|jgi:hypothetical protein|nr:hypothetical protein [Planctomycetaceae bacterium]
MGREIYRTIIDLVLRAAKLARSIGIDNLLQPGLVKEMIIADILGHELITSKRNADAHAADNPCVQYDTCRAKKAVRGNLIECSKVRRTSGRSRLLELPATAKFILRCFMNKSKRGAK